MKLDRVYTMPELAAMIGWGRRRLVRHLHRMNDECGGALLKNLAKPGARPRWTTTLDALKSSAPQWFRDAETIESRLEAVEDAQARDESLLEMHTARIAALSADLKATRQLADLLSKNLRQLAQRAA